MVGEEREEGDKKGNAWVDATRFQGVCFIVYLSCLASACSSAEESGSPAPPL
jgi:hypothetical protein